MKKRREIMLTENSVNNFNKLNIGCVKLSTKNTNNELSIISREVSFFLKEKGCEDNHVVFYSTGVNIELLAECHSSTLKLIEGVLFN